MEILDEELCQACQGTEEISYKFLDVKGEVMTNPRFSLHIYHASKNTFHIYLCDSKIPNPKALEGYGAVVRKLLIPSYDDLLDTVFALVESSAPDLLTDFGGHTVYELDGMPKAAMAAAGGGG